MIETTKETNAAQSENVKLTATKPAKALIGNLIMGPQVALHASKSTRPGNTGQR